MALFDKLRAWISGLFGGGGDSGDAARKAAEEIHKRWARLVEQELRSTRQVYKEAMQIHVGPGTVTLSLNSRFANMLEWGAEPWDLREGLLKKEGNPWPKRSKKGHLYRPIFFRVKTSQIQEWGGWAAYRKHAIKLSPTIRTGMSATGWGEKLGPRTGRARRLRPVDLPPLQGRKGPLARLAHATDPLHGLYRMKEKIGDRPYYGTFRMISWGSKPWTHPGFRPKGLMKKAAKGVGGAVISFKR